MISQIFFFFQIYFVSEHLNVQLFELAQMYHTALGKVDTSQYQPKRIGNGYQLLYNEPLCDIFQPNVSTKLSNEMPNSQLNFTGQIKTN